ncbi:MAG TPA: helix-turn-helix domain-containing protein [Gemmatimonadaceae bacterium]|nr:helix-turn-helix domain-containing protein [Gemmatimonadaceae bacterium]
MTPLADGYTEYAPPPSLREYVECFWTRGAGSPNAAAEHIIPDGCVDLVLGYHRGSESPNASLAVGTMTRPLVIGGDDRLSYVGVRFWPGRALPFLGVPAAALTDLRVQIADLWADRGLSLEHLDGHEPAAVRGAFEALLHHRLERARPLDRTVDAAVRAILRAGGNLSIASLAPALGVTRQHLARSFALHVGVAPKMFARVARVRHALAKARVAATVDWAALALDAGFYDQAHLSGEVRELTGRTPSEWLASA